MESNGSVKSTLCVTGASGYLASGLVKGLLLSGYHVRGTVRDPESLKKVEHLWKLEGAKERLQLVKTDLMGEGSFDEAVMGCEGVFHTASPAIMIAQEKGDIGSGNQGHTECVEIMQKEPLPHKRVVFTSSSSAATIKPNLDPQVPIDESSWSSVELCTNLQLWYPLSKALSEKEAFKFVEEDHIDLVSVIPSVMIGPSISPNLNASAKDVLGLLKGYIHINDVVQCHILVYENANAHGRYLYTATTLDNNELVSILAKRYPTLPIPKGFGLGPLSFLPRYKYDTFKLANMGFQFKGIEEMFDDCIKSLKEQGHLTL